MDTVAKKTGQLNVRIDPALLPDLEEIEARFRIGQSELVRGLVEAAVLFYREHKYFTFPIRVWPEKEFLSAVMKTAELDTEGPEVKAAKEGRPKPTTRKVS